MRFKRTLLFVGAAVTAALVAAAGSPGKAAAAPSDTSRPAISGSGPRFASEWQRRVGAGGGGADGSGAPSTSFTLGSADVAHTLRVVVTASNGNGSSSATTAETDLIAPAKSTQGGAAIAVAQVSLPNRLVGGRGQVNPKPGTSRSPIPARFHASGTRGGLCSRAPGYLLA